jgi:hypothetical protein
LFPTHVSHLRVAHHAIGAQVATSFSTPHRLTSRVFFSCKRISMAVLVPLIPTRHQIRFLIEQRTKRSVFSLHLQQIAFSDDQARLAVFTLASVAHSF